jgi:ABC-2 type transport system permease protein
MKLLPAKFRSPFGLHVFWMTFRETWKGFFVFTLMMLFMFGGIVQIFPSFSEAFMEDVAEAQGIRLEWEDEDQAMANLSWTPVEDATNYTVLQDNQSFSLGSFIGLIEGTGWENLTVKMVYYGPDVFIHLPIGNETLWYIVLIELADGNMTSTGIVSTETLTEDNPFDEFLNSSGYQGFTGGRDMDFLDIRGFMTIYVGSYLSLMVGLYAAYLGVTVVSRDVERKSMDIILSNPISRRRLVIERVAAMSMMMLVLLLLLLGIVLASVESVGEDVRLGDITTTFLLAWPLLLVILAWSALISVVFNDMKMGIGISLGVTTFLYILSFASFITESLGYLNTITPFGYYKFADTFYGEWSAWGDVVVLGVLFAVLIFLCLELFQRKELPT